MDFHNDEWLLLTATKAYYLKDTKQLLGSSFQHVCMPINIIYRVYHKTELNNPLSADMFERKTLQSKVVQFQFDSSSFLYSN